MIKTPIKLQDLRRKIYAKAKADTAWRFWGLYVHVCKLETLNEAYLLAKKNNGAPGIDGVTFEAIEAGGVEAFLKQIQDELAAHRYRPMRNRRQEIPKGDGKVRVLGIPTVRAYCTSSHGGSGCGPAGPTRGPSAMPSVLNQAGGRPSAPHAYQANESKSEGSCRMR
jgi:RNA-directed DNA polymerase